jgi:Ca2+-binding RTX toxin-like protein
VRTIIPLRRVAVAPVATLVAVLVVAGSVWAHPARTIRGTRASETLKGTAAADVIDGRAGNDRLIGLGGDDLLMGGPGADTYSCGSGRDTVVGDRSDRRPGQDCEVVKGIPLPPPSAPPGPTARPGRYCGFTNQGVGVCVDVRTDGRSITNISTEAVADCEPRARFNIRVAPSGTYPIGADLSFSYDYRGPELEQHMTGRFDTEGRLTGTLQARAKLTVEGTVYGCDSGAPTGYMATLGA